MCPRQVRNIIGSTIAIVCLPSVIWAQDSGSFYLKAFGGASALQGNDFALDGVSTGVSFDTGFIAGGAFGFDYANSPFRAELEYTHRTGDAGGLDPTIASEGDLASTSLMLNGYYLFDSPSGLSPYLGLGVGYATEIDFDLTTPTGSAQFSDTSQFAYQIIAGAEYPLSDRWSVYGEARYFSAGKVSLPGTGGTVLTTDYDTLDLIVGASLSF